MKKPLVIILMGPPGSGKGTQAELLSDKFNLYYLETSKIIEANVMEAKKGDYVKIKGKKYSLLQEKKLWLSGILCTPLLVSFWVKNKIKQLYNQGQGIVMAGSPRTLPEGKDQIPFLKKLYSPKNIKIFLLEVDPQVTIQRNSQRRICELMRHPILSTRKEFLRLKYCPLDGSKLIKRKGLDDPETIKIRLKEYKERTLPLIKYFRQQGLRVKKINGEQSVENIFKNILKFLGKSSH